MGLARLLLALLSAAAAELSAFETSVLLQSRTGTVPGQDAVSLQVGNWSAEVGNRSIGEIFALPADVTGFIAGRSNSKAKISWHPQADYSTLDAHDRIFEDIDEFLDLDHLNDMIDLTHNITRDFNTFYKISLELGQKLMWQFQIHRMDVAKVKHFMLDQFEHMKRFAAAAHSHLMQVVEDVIAAAKEAEANSEGDMWSWDERDESAEWATWLANAMQHIEGPVVKILVIWQAATTDLFNLTRVEFCTRAVTALQALVNVSQVLQVDVAPMVEFIDTEVVRRDKAVHAPGGSQLAHGLHEKMAVECTIMTEMFFRSVESWVEYVNATMGGAIAHSFGCPLTQAPKLPTPPFVADQSWREGALSGHKAQKPSSKDGQRRKA